jgi:hypothetical protein
MFWVTLILLVLAAIIYFNNPKGSSNRWGAGVSFMCSLGALGRFIEFSLPVSFLANNNFCVCCLKIVMSICYGGGIFYAPYFFLKFALLSSTFRFYHDRIKFCDLIMNLPVLISIALSSFPLRLYSPNYRMVLLYAVPYMLVSGGILLWTAFQETALCERRPKIMAAVLLMFIAIVCSIVNYINPAFGLRSYDEINFLTAVLVFIVFLFAAYHYGNLGVRIKFEHTNLSSIEAINTGASLMNHAIKNELALIYQSINAIERKLDDI